MGTSYNKPEFRAQRYLTSSVGRTDDAIYIAVVKIVSQPNFLGHVYFFKPLHKEELYA
jgi:hypothetical protein